MTTTTYPSPVPRDAATDDPQERGRTTIVDRTVERLSMQAITEVDGIGGAATRMLGVAVGSENIDKPAQITARVSGETASLDMRLSVTYPASVSETTEKARQHLMRRIAEFTGLTVSRVDITVTALHSNAAETRRVQ